MERIYMRSCLVGLAVLLSGAAVAQAQEPPPVKMIAQEGPGADQSQSMDPTGPIQSGTVADAQYFKQPDLTQIGTYPELNYGPWFQYERLYWSFHQPPSKEIGDPTEALALLTPNDSNTGFMNAGFAWGNRFDFGYWSDDNLGWAMSILKTNNQFNTYNVPNQTNVTFVNNEPSLALQTLGIPGIVATTSGFFPSYLPAYPDIAHIQYTNITRMTGVELMRTYRYPVAHDGGIWSIGGGVRFLQLHDRFDATGESNQTVFFVGSVPAGTTPVSTPAESQTLFYGPAPISWDLGIDNDIVGPQIQIEYEYDKERWDIDTSFRALFGANFENASMYGWTGGPIINQITGVSTTTIGATNTPSNQFFSKSNRVEFAPVGEFRINLDYKITQNIKLTAGFTGMIMTGIGRGSQRIVYTLPDLQILNGATSQHFFADGVNVGIEFNH